LHPHAWFRLLVAGLAEIIAARMDEPDGASALGREARARARRKKADDTTPDISGTQIFTRR